MSDDDATYRRPSRLISGYRVMTSDGAGVESPPGLTVADGLQILREDRGEDLRLSSST